MNTNILDKNRATQTNIITTKGPKIKVIFIAICMLFSGINSAISTPTTQNINNASIKRDANITDFDLDREITIYSTSTTDDSKLMCNRVIDLLKNTGCSDVKISRKPGNYNIHIERVNQIFGVDSTISDAYCMKIYKNEVKIEYLSTKSMAWAFQALRSNIVRSQNIFQKMFDLSSLKIQASSLCETSGISGSFEIIDLTKNPMNIETLQKQINTAAMNNKFIIYLKLVSSEGVAIKSEMINSVNPFIEISNSGMSYGQLNEIFKMATDNGIELIPLLDFVSSDNKYFEQYTGHKIHSTEGLRFSRVLASEFAMLTNFNVVCLGGEPSDIKIKEKYLDPLVEIFNVNNKDVVIHINQ